MSLNLRTSVPTLLYKWWDLVWGLLKFNFDNKRLMVAFVFGDSVIPRAKLFLYRRNIDLCFPGGFPPTLYSLLFTSLAFLHHSYWIIKSWTSFLHPLTHSLGHGKYSYLFYHAMVLFLALLWRWYTALWCLWACASDQAQRAIKITTALKAFETFFLIAEIVTFS